MPEFQPRTLASFSLHQLGNILKWGENNNFSVYTEGSAKLINSMLDVAQFDEKGKPMNPKGRERIMYGYLLMMKIVEHGDLPNLDHGSIWLVSESPKLFEFRWKHRGDFLESRASEEHYLGRV